MTAESEAMSGAEMAPSADSVAVPAMDDAVPFIKAALACLAVSMVLGALAGLQILVPDLFRGVGFLGYGRLYPVATNLFVYGWLTIGLAGALIYVLGKAGRIWVDDERMVKASLGLLVLGVVVGSLSVAFGFTEGRPLLDYPLWADVFIVGGLVALARILGSMARRSLVEAGPVRWYALAASWWFVLAFVVGNIPGISGVAGAVQTSFYRASLIGLWLASAGVAVVYHVIPKLAGRDAYTPTRLTVLGFWSLAFVWALTGPATLVYSPAPDWLETLGAVFSIGLLIPPAVIFADLLLALRRRWEIAGGGITLRFLVLGGALFALWPVANLAMSLRASSGLVQFTDWVRGVEILGFYGFASAWLVAFVYFAAPDVLRGAMVQGRARLHYFGTVLGLMIWAGSSLLAGVTAGFTWVASANEAAVPAAGVGFSNTLAGVEGYYVAAFIGLLVFAAAQLLFVASAFTASGFAERREPVEVDEPEPDAELVLEGGIGSSRLRWGVVGLFTVAAVFTWLVPWADVAGAEATILADSDRRYGAAGEVADGRAIYVQEGCMYCHTQQVRPIVADVGLGPASVTGDYVYESPVVFGVQRIGPDLMHVGSRPETDDPEWVASYLRDPRDQRSYSIMPSYDHLSSSDLSALAAYIVGSK